MPSMGFYDRDYYRRDGSHFGDWLQPHKVCTYLIAANVIMFVAQLATRTVGLPVMDGPVTSALDLQPDRVARGEVWRLLTHAFLHSLGWQHIVFNMLILWWAGRSVEEIYGSKEFLAFYLVAAVLAGLAYCGVEWATGANRAALGASGAVTAVMVVFACHYPMSTVYLFFLIPVPVAVVAVLYVAADLFQLFSGPGDSSVGVAAHLGGALFGFLYYKLQFRVLNWVPTRMSMRPRRARPRLRVYREPVEEDTPLSGEEDQLEAQLDSVLAKVAKYGRDALSEREHQILLKASEVYKQRRK